jgi:hypothetical protein
MINFEVKQRSVFSPDAFGIYVEVIVSDWNFVARTVLLFCIQMIFCR